MFNFIKKKINYLIKRIAYASAAAIEERGMTNQPVQTMLMMHYKSLLQDNKKLPSLQETGFRIFSQTNEDGILLYLFSLVGFTNRRCVDIAFASPYGSNTANLLCNHGFTGLLVCGSADEKKLSDDFFKRHPEAKLMPPTVVHTWVTVEKINGLLRDHGMIGQIDLLSLDLDGIDYWLWQNIEVIDPRIVVVEFQNLWPEDKAVTVPYDPEFERLQTHPDYFGASLRAFVQLAQKKGYRLVGCNKLGFNAFFIKHDLISELFLPTVSVHDALQVVSAIPGQGEKLAVIKQFLWLDV